MVHVPWQPESISRMVSLQSKISSTLPRFDDAGDLAIPLEARKEEDIKGFEIMGDLEKELLVSQLSDLNSWIHKVRDADELKGRPLPPPVDREDVAPPGVESLLRAQVQELEGWMIECRTTAQTWSVDAYEPVSQVQETDEELLLALRKERMWSVRKTPAPKDETAHAQQRLESAFATLNHMREAETQKSLALEQVRSVGLQTAEDFTRLHAQLHELESDPMRAPELARYAPTDVALALLGAIEQRCALARTLREALRAQEKVRSGAEAFEQLLSCASAWPVAFQVAEQEGADSPEINYAPASLLTFPGAPLGEGSTDIQDAQVARLHKLAERNRMLWEQAYAHWDTSSRTKGPMLMESSRRGGKTVSFESGGGASALQSELMNLRAAEGRLDQLLGGGPSSPGLTHRFDVAAALSHLPQMQSMEEKSKEIDMILKAKELPGLGKFSLGPFAVMTMEDIFEKWFMKAHQLQEWRHTRRQQACTKFLHSKSAAKAIRYLIARVTVNVEMPVAADMAKGERVRDVKTNRIGTFCSRTPKGVCKIQWSHTEVSVKPATELVWLTRWPHPALGGICFLAWQQILVIHENKAVARFREKVKEGSEAKKSAKMLYWLSASAHEDMTDMMRLCFTSWRKTTHFQKQEMQEMLGEIFLVWRHGAMQSRHARAVNALQSTSSELRDARMSVARHKYRFDKLQVKLNKIDDMERGLYLSYVISSWHYSVQMERMTFAVNLSSRAQRIEIGLQLSDTMQKQKDGAMVPAVFTAWKMRTMQRTQSRNKQAIMSMAFSGASLRVTFTEWRMLVQGDKQLSAEAEIQKVNTQLVEKIEEFEKLQAVTEELYGFSREADARVKQLEDALGAADNAIEAGTKHGQVLEKEVSSLETQLQAMEARVRRGDEAERELRIEREEKAALKLELGSTRGERENLANRLQIMENKVRKAENDLEEERRRVSSEQAERATIERALEEAREEAASWKLQAQAGRPAPFSAGGGGGGGEDRPPLPPPPSAPGGGGAVVNVDDVIARIDKDGDGQITEKELKKAIKKGIVTEEEAEQAATKIQIAFRRSIGGGGGGGGGGGEVGLGYLLVCEIGLLFEAKSLNSNYAQAFCLRKIC
mmetsp:Transcript_136784/g.262924  ORF Transcript_136784/g.262924 Transcript_136784/m.262924 type:complete len:1110 (+) Transcript_136784:99-3428(+)